MLCQTPCQGAFTIFGSAHNYQRVCLPPNRYTHTVLSLLISSVLAAVCSKYGQRPNEILTTNVLRCWALLLPCRQLMHSWLRKGHSLLCHHTLVSQNKCPSQSTYLLRVFLQSCSNFELCSLVRVTLIQPQYRTWAQCLRDAYWQEEIICLEIGMNA